MSNRKQVAGLFFKKKKKKEIILEREKVASIYIFSSHADRVNIGIVIV